MDDRQKTEAERIAAEIERAELTRSVERLSYVLEGVRKQLSDMERRLADAESRAEDLEGDIESMEESSASGGVEAESQAAEDDDGGTSGSPPHAFQVETTSDGKVLCFLPKMPDGTYFPVAMGGKHIGASTGTTADLDAGPYPAGGPVSGSERPTWAHWGWYELDDTLDMESGEVNDKLVIASFSVPRDPPEDERDDDTQVEGPKLTGIELMDAEDWQDHAEQTWKEFDPGGRAPLTREVVIAHIANGIVTQVTMTPFLSPGDGGSDDWHADSEGGVNFSIDPVSRVPEYETEDESVDVPTYKTVIGLDGKPTKVQTGTKTVTRQKVKLDGNGQPIAKQAQQLDENGDPAVDGQGNPIMGPCFTESLYHQVHNFDSGNDNGLVELADENNYGGTQVACRIPGAGGAELFWRRIPRSPGQPCPPTYALDEQAGSGCTEKTIVLKKTEYTPNSSGGCDPGTPTIVGGGIAISKPPEYTLAASGSCSKTVTLYKTPCGGSATSAGSFSFDVPPAISATSTGNSSGGALAGTVTVTPCGGTAVPINIYNGKDGAQGPQGPQGCSPDISVEPLSPGSTQGGEAGGEKVTITKKVPDGSGGCQTDEVLTFIVHNGVKGEDGDAGEDGCSPIVTPNSNPSHTDGDGRVLAGTIQGRTRGVNGCEDVPGSLISVYNGKDGGGLNETILTGLVSLSVTSAGLVLVASTATYTNGVKTGTGTTSVTCPVTTCS